MRLIMAAGYPESGNPPYQLIPRWTRKIKKVPVAMLALVWLIHAYTARPVDQIDCYVYLRQRIKSP